MHTAPAASAPTYRELHEHAVLCADVPALLATNGAWYVNGASSAWHDAPIWGYAECGAIADGMLALTLTDPVDISGHYMAHPITGAGATITLSRSFAAGETCPACGDVATHPGQRQALTHRI